jgi:glycogen operon protein
MLLGGDEFLRTQGGNNNAWCQDNAISWVDWSARDEGLLAFTRRLLRIRGAHPALRRRKFFSGRPIRGSDTLDVSWFRHDGQVMADEDWNNPHTKSLAMFLAGNGLDATDRAGRPVLDDHLLLMMSAWSEDLAFTLPAVAGCQGWELILDTATDAVDEHRTAGESSLLVAHSLKLFRCPLAGARPASAKAA